jgi:hypothetical protein
MDATQEQKDILEIKDDIKSIRTHLNNFKANQLIEDSYRLEQNRKLDLIVNALTDNDFNGKNGIITKVNALEKKVDLHEVYWKVLLTVLIAGGVLAGLIKILIPK